LEELGRWRDGERGRIGEKPIHPSALILHFFPSPFHVLESKDAIDAKKTRLFL
jgi:hypothetical protein